MNKTFVLTLIVCLTGCACGRPRASEKQLRRALADTNAALTEAQNRASAYQDQSQRLARKLYKKHKRAHQS